MLEHGFCGELDVFHLSFYSLGVRILGPSAGQGKAPRLASLAIFAAAVASIAKKTSSFQHLLPTDEHFEVINSRDPSSFILLAFSAQPWDCAQRRRPAGGKLQSHIFWCISTQYGVHSTSVAFFPPHQTYVWLDFFLLPSSLVGKSCAWQSIAAPALRSHSWGSERWGCTLHPLMHMSGGTCCLKWQSLIHICPSLLQGNCPTMQKHT